MKTLIISLLCVFQLLNCQTIDPKDSISIYFLDSRIMTPYKITSNYFDKYFLKAADSLIIKDQEVLKKIVDQVSNIKPLANKSLPDIRQKFIIRENNSITTIYSNGESLMEIDGQVVFDKELQELINSLIKQKE